MICLKLPWNSLEIFKLIISGATFIIVFFLGLWIRRFTKQIEHAQWSNQKVIEWRLEVYDVIVPLANDLFFSKFRKLEGAYARWCCRNKKGVG